MYRFALEELQNRIVVVLHILEARRAHGAARHTSLHHHKIAPKRIASFEQGPQASSVNGVAFNRLHFRQVGQRGVNICSNHRGRTDLPGISSFFFSLLNSLITISPIYKKKNALSNVNRKASKFCIIVELSRHGWMVQDED